MINSSLDYAFYSYLQTHNKSKYNHWNNSKKGTSRLSYGRILNFNKETPLYKIKNLEDSKSFALQLKDQVTKLNDFISSLNMNEESLEESFTKHYGKSSDEESVKVSYVGNETNLHKQDHKIVVTQLAKPQVNKSTFLHDLGQTLSAGEHNFRVTVEQDTYEFQFQVKDRDTNLDVLQKINNLFHKANLGIHSELIEGEDNTTALRLTSSMTGEPKEDQVFFRVSSVNLEDDFFQQLGLQEVSSYPENATFYVDEELLTSPTNTYILNQDYSLELQNITQEPVTIGLKEDGEALADTIGQLMNFYNNIVTSVKNASDSNNSGKLLWTELKNLSSSYKKEFETMGLDLNEDGEILVNEKLLTKKIAEDKSHNFLDTLKSFKDSLYKKSTSVSMNPMNYVDKIIVNYKNPGRSYVTPYISSIYSGMMLNYYC